MYSAFALLFIAVCAVMLAVLTAAMILIPAGLLAGVVGGLLLVLESPFIITDMSPVLMLCGGFCAAFAAAFFGFAAIKAGIGVSRLFLRVRKHCDRLRGW